MRNQHNHHFYEAPRDPFIAMAAVAIANGFGVVFVSFILVNAVGLEPEQLIFPNYSPPVKIIRLSSLDYSTPLLKQ